MAASTRGRTIRLQPADVLRDAGTLESTLRHELLHILIESHAKPGTPLWYREGLALYLARPGAEIPPSGRFENLEALDKTLRAPATEQALREAYAEAQSRVAKLVQQHGKETLLDWLQNGMPAQ